MKALPTHADIFLRFRDEDFGRRKVPGLEVETDGGGVRSFENLRYALAYIKQLHDDNLKETE